MLVPGWVTGDKNKAVSWSQDERGRMYEKKSVEKRKEYFDKTKRTCAVKVDIGDKVLIKKPILGPGAPLAPDRGSACPCRPHEVQSLALLLQQLFYAASPRCLSGPRLLRYREAVEEAADGEWCSR
ncbi:hypothetical protein NDU88_006145 [Pleurodeles waltl]|uniref:Uncharacterized protein n=1 Tax=Pleurodeles waltl TaxID=8319 RepID=A0AAV7TW04_PLEWA|nr:hypothetical protein NDU88_006145 [Pleurodeles waltl]